MHIITLAILFAVFFFISCSGPMSPSDKSKIKSTIGVARPKSFKWTNQFETPDGLPNTPSSFRTAKRRALKVIYKDHRVTFYCLCGYDDQKRVDASKCGYEPRNDNVRARRIEWEHLVSASAFGQHRACWKPGTCPRKRGRRCCRKIDSEFRRMEADLQNLVPAVGELNAARSNYRFGDVPGEAREFGKCDFEVDRTNRITEPPPARRGEIARTYLYMHFAYKKGGKAGLPLTKAQIERFLKWHRADPPDQWERERNKRIAAIQDGGNPLIYF